MGNVSYYIIGVLIALLVLTLLFKPKAEKLKRQLKKLSDEDFLNGIRSVARENRIIDSGGGKGVNLHPMMRYLLKAERILLSKVLSDKILSEGEKWFYENLYYVKRFSNGININNFNMLPHSSGGIRILNIARYIIENSNFNLDTERVKKAIDICNNETILTYNEINSLKTALGIALFEQIYILSRRIIHYNKMERHARHGIKLRHFKSDIYLHFLLQKKHKDSINDLLTRKGINPSGVTFNYSLSVVETSRMARYLFESIKSLNDILTDEESFSLLLIDKLLGENLVYKDMAFETKKLYLSKIASISEKINRSELEVTKKLINFSEYNKIDSVIVLFEHTLSLISYIRNPNKIKKIKNKTGKAKEIYYIVGVIISALTMSVGSFFIFGNIIIPFFAILPSIIIAEGIINFILSAIIKPRPLPEMNYQTIPSEHSTMIVVSEFIATEKQMKEAISHLKAVREINIDKNITAALLIDLKPGDSEVLSTDKEIINLAKELEGVEGYAVFIRKRTKINNKYQAYERKRGAIMALSKLLVENDGQDFVYISNPNMMKPEYIIALDSDNVTSINGAKELINIIAHPANGRYDLIASRSNYNLYSLKTLFSKRRIKESHFVNYPNYSSLYYNLFGRDIFCGKGIFRLKSFYYKLKDVFPDNKVLSHDIIEGAILNTASGSVVYEDAPKNFISDRERLKRWARGDIQLLPFAMKGWKNRLNEEYCSQIHPIYKFLIFRNVVNILSPIFILAIGILGIFVPVVFYAFLFFAAFPLLIEILGIIRSGVMGHERTKYVLCDISIAISNTLIEIGLLPYYAYCNLKLLLTTLIKMIKKGNLLEWKTYYQSQSGGGKFVNETAISMLIIPIVSAFGFVFDLFYLPVLCFGVLSYAMYLMVYLLGVTKVKKTTPHPKLNAYTLKTYQYFKYMRKSSYLIADNLQVKPYKGMSPTTSPTNIGFQIIAEISGYLLQYSGRAETLSVLEDIIYQVERLKKWQGNLYNWYNIRDSKPAILFVSSVDSGNFVASLIILNEFLLEENEPSLAKRVQVLIEKTDLKSLYDNYKHQFFLGYNQETDRFEGHYDLLASESRLLSFVYSAIYGDSVHWKSLVRDFTPIYGNTLFSWSGTMFEYLMPDIFVDPPKHSLCKKSSKNAVKAQIRHKIRGIFGLSESGYYSFDDGLRYQYKAFGIDKLALGRDKEKNVVSPYSTFMALEIKPRQCLANLEKLEGIGAFGEYGFYEAVDMEGQTRILNSYMTHHQGMIMASLTNILTLGKLRKLMMNNPKIRGASIILTEPVERGQFSQKIEVKREKSLNRELDYYKYFTNLEYSTVGAGLTDGTLTSYFDCLGGGFMQYNGMLVNRFIRGAEECSGRHFYVIDGERITSPTYLTLKDSKSKYTFSYTPVSITYHNTDDNIKLDCTVDGNLFAEINKLTLNSGAGKRIAFYEPLALNGYEAQNAHPTFNNMFVFTEFVPQYNAIIAKRRLRKNEKPFFVALVIFGVNNIEAETNRYNFIGRGRSEKNPIFIEKKALSSDSFGDVLEPCFAFKGEMTSDSCQIIKIASDSYDDLIQKISRIPEDYYSFSTEIGNIFNLSQLTNSLLYPLMSASYDNKVLIEIDKLGLRNQFIDYTKGNKLIVFKLENGNDLSSLRQLAESVLQLRYFRLYPTLSIIISNNLIKDSLQSVKDLLEFYHIFDYKIYFKREMPEHYLQNAFLVLDKSLNVPAVYEYLRLFNTSTMEKNFISDFEYKLKTGQGGLVDDGYLLPLAKLPSLPYSNVICDKNGGFIVTENGGGVTFYKNSHEKRITRFDNDPVKDTPYEFIAIGYKDNIYRINGSKGVTDYVTISKGISTFTNRFEDFSCDLSMYIINQGSVKINELSFDLNQNCPKLKLFYGLECVLGAGGSSPFIYSERIDKNVFKIKNLLSYQECFVKILTSEQSEIDYKGQNATIIIDTSLNLKDGDKVYIAMGQYTDIMSLNYNQIELKKKLSIKYFAELNNIAIKTPDVALNELFNDWLLYQVVSSRLNGKCGFYQLGGATGFRDQLQDVLALIHNDPIRVRNQILLHAERQYKEGDVMHWWHDPHVGLRSKISDDKLFLPYVTAEYVLATGDESILKEKVSFLDSPLLNENEDARYENAKLTTEKYPLHEHCLRAIKNAINYGEHGLLLLGTGDWNDGMDYIGEKGKGESVVLTMFAYETINKYLAFCDEKTKIELNAIAEGLKKAVKNSAYDGKQFMRLYGDDGKWYGSYRCDCLNIDLISQSFAVLSGIAETDEAKSAIKESERLIDSENGIIKLLSPALSDNCYIGYISAYPKGVRENGGQYTHGAIWYIIALLRLGETEKAYELFCMINPMQKCRDRAKNLKYKGEPYVMPADVYAYQNAGRMGWSWYTGSASWTYRLILEEFFGIKKRGNRLYVEPKLPKSLSGSQLIYKNDNLEIKFEFISSGSNKLTVDGLTLHSKRYIDLLNKIDKVIVEF